MFILLLSFSESLARDRTKCLSLNDEPCIIRSTLIDLNPVEFKYYPFTISLDKFNGSCNILLPKICVPKKTINVKVFNMITNKNKLKQWQNIFHVIVNANSIVQHLIQIKNGITKHVNVNIKLIISSKKIIVGTLAYVIVRIANV